MKDTLHPPLATTPFPALIVREGAALVEKRQARRNKPDATILAGVLDDVAEIMARVDDEVLEAA